MKIHGICSKIIILSLLCAASPLFSETFRVRKLFPIKLTGTIQNEQTFVTGINDCIAIFLPDDRSWLEGIEIKIAIPEAVAAWQDSVALSLYDNITPRPSPRLLKSITAERALSSNRFPPGFRGSSGFRFRHRYHLKKAHMKQRSASFPIQSGASYSCACSRR